MGEAKRTIIVHIFDQAAGDNGLGFGMSGFGVQARQIDNKPNFEIKCAKDKAGMAKKDPHKVTFEINNRSSKDLLFAHLEKNAIWVSENATDCPQNDPGEHADFPLKDMKLSSDREQLTVQNLNSCKADFKFSLNFVEASAKDDSQMYSYDPIWTNQNGGSVQGGG